MVPWVQTSYGLTHKGHIVSVRFSKGNIDDRIGPDKMVHHLKGLPTTNKGYISLKREDKLRQQGLKPITKTRKNMKKKEFLPQEKEHLRRRNIIETVFGMLKGIFDLATTRARSFIGLITQIVAALIAYQLKALQRTVNKYSLYLIRS